MWRSAGPQRYFSGTKSVEPVELGPDPTLNLAELDSLPKGLHDGAQLIMNRETAERPDSIANLPDLPNENLANPVSEAVLEDQPTFYWLPAFSPPPYTVTVWLGPDVVARGQGIANTSWMVPMPLKRGKDYIWQLTAPDASERASFHIIEEEQSKLWATIKAEHAESHLVLGLVAEQFGMLGIAEREYVALAKDHPRSDIAARLLSNIQELRDR
jgi:hypothetical protein